MRIHLCSTRLRVRQTQRRRRAGFSPMDFVLEAFGFSCLFVGCPSEGDRKAWSGCQQGGESVGVLQVVTTTSLGTLRLTLAWWATLKRFFWQSLYNGWADSGPAAVDFSASCLVEGGGNQQKGAHNERAEPLKWQMKTKEKRYRLPSGEMIAGLEYFLVQRKWFPAKQRHADRVNGRRSKSKASDQDGNHKKKHEKSAYQGHLLAADCEKAWPHRCRKRKIRVRRREWRENTRSKWDESFPLLKEEHVSCTESCMKPQKRFTGF